MADQETKATNQFNQLPLQQKLMLGVAGAAVLALFVGLWMWGQSPDYRVLYGNLSDRDGGAIIASLQQMNIPYKFADSGGALMVPSNQVYEARLKLASQGLPKGGSVGFELMENQRFGITQFAEQVNYQRALEGELARSVQSIGSVAGARVHLAIPKPSVFIKEQQKPSASVVLNLQGGRLLDMSQVSAIVHLISASVPELSAKNVTVVDQNGTLLSASHDGTPDGGLDENQLKYLHQVEQSYVSRIERLLTPLMGPDNVRVQVSADIDFSRTEQTSEIFKPNQPPNQSAVRSQQSSEAVSGSGSQTGGVPGALTNQPPIPATAPIVSGPGAQGNSPTASVNNSQKESTVNYEVDRTISHTVLPVGVIKRLSVAVLLNANRKTTDAKGKTISSPLSTAEQTQIDNLIRDAMGYDQNRGDSVNVQVAAFSENKENVEETPLWKQPDVVDLVMNLLKYALIAGIVLFVIFRIIKPAITTLLSPPAYAEAEEGAPAVAAAAAVPGGEGYTPAIAPYEQNLQVARQIAQQEPKIVASVIKDWVSKNE
jgi:flagellar M-ring protein FliF